MPRPLLICSALSPDELRRKARDEEDRRAAMRMLGIAAAMDGLPRPQAARLADMSDQALRDAIRRYNAEGLDGLHDRPRPGRPPKLTEAQGVELKAIVVAGPDIEKDGLSAYTRDDIARIAKERWGIGYHATSIGRILKGLGLSRQKPRPTHPKKDPLAAEALKKGPGDPAVHCRYT